MKHSRSKSERQIEKASMFFYCTHWSLMQCVFFWWEMLQCWVFIVHCCSCFCPSLLFLVGSAFSGWQCILWYTAVIVLIYGNAFYAWQCTLWQMAVQAVPCERFAPCKWVWTVCWLDLCAHTFIFSECTTVLLMHFILLYCSFHWSAAY